MKKIFYKYFLIYAGLFLILICGNFKITQITRQLIWEDLVIEKELNLEKGVREFDETIGTLKSFGSYIAATDSVRKLRKEKDFLKRENYVELNNARTMIDDMCSIGNLPYTFILFKNNPVFLSEKQTHFNFEEYYQQFMEAGSMSAMEFKDYIFSYTNEVNYISFDEFRYYDGKDITIKNSLLISVRPRLSSGNLAKDFLCIFVMPKQQIMSYIASEIELDSNVICVCDSENEILLAHGDEHFEKIDFRASIYETDEDTYRLLQDSTEDDRLHFILGISYETVNEQADIRTKMITRILILLAFYTIFAILYLTWRRYQPTKKMLEYLSETTSKEYEDSNEYEYVERVTNTLVGQQAYMERELTNLKHEMNNTILSSVLTQGIVKEQDINHITSILPKKLEYYYIVIFVSDEISSDNLYEISLELQEIFKKIYGAYLYAFHKEVSETVFLIPQEEQEIINSMGMIEKLMEVSNCLTKQRNITFSVGISGIGHGIKSMNNTYEQARQACIYTNRENINTVGYYSEIRKEIGNETLEANNVFHIYEYILAGNRDAIECVFNKIEKSFLKSGDSQKNKRMFYTLLYIVQAAEEKLGIVRERFSEYRDITTAYQEQMECLKKEIFEVIDAYDKNKKSHNTDLKDAILKYMKENYMNANLTALEVCEAMHISEKYLTQFLKEQTLKSFSKCLEEIRINKAKEYLINTKWSNKKIAEEVGFGSVNTFYRVFQKVEGITPMNWKNNMLNKSNHIL